MKLFVVIWPEAEFCIESETALPKIASGAPGTYSVYDCSNSVKFNDRTLPNQITTSVGEASFFNRALLLEVLTVSTPRSGR